MFRRLYILVAAVIAISGQLYSQNSSENTGVRLRDRNQNTRQQGQTASNPRAQVQTGTSRGDADVQWMRVIYRQLDLNDDKNAALYFPEDPIDGQENLFRIMMRLVSDGTVTPYEYLDGREIFADKYRVNMKDVFSRFYIPYTEAKGSTEKNPRYTIDENDVPTNEVLSYYIIERWEYDTRANRMKTYVDAICPILHRVSDFGGDPIKYPMFWVKYDDLAPYLGGQEIFISDDNNLPTCTYADYFANNMYKGDIYKTRNLKNQTLMQLYPDPDDLKHAQDSIQAYLDSFEKKFWVPDREEILAAGKAADKTSVAKDKSLDELVAKSDESDSPEEAETAAEDTENKTVRRANPRKKSTTDKSKTSATKKTKTTKIKSTSSSATRSVRRKR